MFRLSLSLRLYLPPPNPRQEPWKRRRGPCNSDIMMETLVDDGVNDAEEGNGNVRRSVNGSSKTGETDRQGSVKTQTTVVTYTVDRVEAREAKKVRSMF